MNKIACALSATLVAATSAAYAGEGGSFGDYARVRGVDAQYEKINVPRKECYTDYIPEARYGASEPGLAGPIIGGVAGGLLGSRFGQGSGKVAAAAVGTLAGTIVGYKLSERPRPTGEVYQREVQRCQMVDSWESRLSGYRVTYEYAGRLYTTMLPYDPGQRLPVNVSVVPDVR